MPSDTNFYSDNPADRPDGAAKAAIMKESQPPSSIIEQGKVEQPKIRLDKDVYTSGQAATIVGIPSRTMRHYLSNGKIVGKQNPITGTWQISRESLEQFIQVSGREVVDVLPEINILVVDDEPTMVSFLKRILEKSVPNAHIILPNNVCDALVQIGVSCPEIVVLDARMPVLSGRELLKAIRSNKRTKGIKILAISGLEDELNELAAMGADATLSKPFTYNELVETLEKMLPYGLSCLMAES